jgi:hypothetical protein
VPSRSACASARAPSRPFGYYPFGVDFQAEITRDGITVPSAFTASWFYGTPEQDAGEFFRATISDVRFGADRPEFGSV